jgi:hypothetical protein
MEGRDLSTLLLVRAIEECDRQGELLPSADREVATRAALREARDATPFASDGSLTAAGVSILLDRAQRLVAGIADHERVIAPLLALHRPGHVLSWLVPVAAFAFGLGLTALDASGWINILAFPLIGVVVWNLAVYAALVVWHARGQREVAPPTLVGIVQGWWRRRFSMARPDGLRAPGVWACVFDRYGRDLSTASLPIAIAQGRRLMHIGAAVIATGLVAGMYMRGLVYRYDAGWDSTFLGVAGVRWWLRVVYGPAAAISGSDLPATENEILALRASSGGSIAAPWIHLIALTAVIYVIVPRCLLAMLARSSQTRLARRALLPAGTVQYARAVLGAVAGGIQAISCEIVPYAYEPDGASNAGLDELLRVGFGASAKIDRRTMIAYGSEDAYAAAADDPDLPASGLIVGLMNMAATPETESHGLALAAWRNRVVRSQDAARLLFIVDEHPLRARLARDATYGGRLAERREVWQRFATAVGMPVLLVDLSDAAAVAGAGRQIESWCWPPVRSPA